MMIENFLLYVEPSYTGPLELLIQLVIGTIGALGFFLALVLYCISLTWGSNNTDKGDYKPGDGSDVNLKNISRPSKSDRDIKDITSSSDSDYISDIPSSDDDLKTRIDHPAYEPDRPTFDILEDSQ